MTQQELEIILDKLRNILEGFVHGGDSDFIIAELESDSKELVEIKDVWHSSEEKPKPLSCCLVEYIDEDIDDEFTNYEVTHYGTDNVGFIGDSRDKKITRWAYIKDLLPIVK